MPSFAIIAEGVTDQAVLENLLIGYFGDGDDEPVVNHFHPPREEDKPSAVTRGLTFSWSRSSRAPSSGRGAERAGSGLLWSA